MSNLPARTLIGNRYVVVEKLGSGSFGTVYKVYSTDTKSVYALKKGRSMTDEAGVLLKVREADPHGTKHCLQLIESFKSRDDLMNLVFPLCGMSIQKFLNKTGRGLPKSHVQSITRQILTGLAFILSIGIVHCDIKTDNILLTDDRHRKGTVGKGSRARERAVLRFTNIVICDFGIARVINNVQQTMRMRTPYNAPELCLNLPWDYAIDVYATALVLCEMRNGRPLIPVGSNAPVTLSILHSLVGPLPKHLATYASTQTNIPRVKAQGRTLFPHGNTAAVWQPTMTESNLCEWADYARKCKQNLVGEKRGGSELKDLLRKMMKYDPKDRITASAALRHPYFSYSFNPPR